MDNTARKFRSRADVDEAIQALPKEEWFRLRKIGQVLCLKLVNRTADDLIHEVFRRVLDGAEKPEGGGRHWPDDVDFVPFFITTMRGIASDWQEQRFSRKQRREAGPDLVLVEREGLGTRGDVASEDIPDTDWMKATADPEIAIMRKQECEKILGDVKKTVADNDNACLLVDALAEGMTREEIKDLFGFDDKDYDSLRRFLRRRINKSFPGGYPS